MCGADTADCENRFFFFFFFSFLFSPFFLFFLFCFFCFFCFFCYFCFLFFLFSFFLFTHIFTEKKGISQIISLPGWERELLSLLEAHPSLSSSLLSLLCRSLVICGLEEEEESDERGEKKGGKKGGKKREKKEKKKDWGGELCGLLRALRESEIREVCVSLSSWIFENYYRVSVLEKREKKGGKRAGKKGEEERFGWVKAVLRLLNGREPSLVDRSINHQFLLVFILIDLYSVQKKKSNYFNLSFLFFTFVLLLVHFPFSSNLTLSLSLSLFCRLKNLQTLPQTQTPTCLPTPMNLQSLTQQNHTNNGSLSSSPTSTLEAGVTPSKKGTIS